MAGCSWWAAQIATARPDLRRAVRPGPAGPGQPPGAWSIPTGRLPRHAAARRQGAGGRLVEAGTCFGRSGPRRRLRRRAIRPGQRDLDLHGEPGLMEGLNRSATLLTNGKVLVAGEHGSQLYDPDSGTWTATGKMVTPRCEPHGHAAARWQGARGGRRIPERQGRAVRPGHGVVDCHRGYARKPSEP